MSREGDENSLGGIRMYSLVGPEEIIKTIYTLSHPYLHLGVTPSFKDIKLGLRQHLSKIQPNVVRSQKNDVEFISFGERIKPLLDILRIGEEKKSDNETKKMSCEEALERVVSGFDYFCQKEVQLSDIFRIVADTVLVTNDVKISGSATISNAIGIIWIQPDYWWTKKDMLEALVHELTHTLLFLDEQRYGHYNKSKNLNNPSTWVPSAIRNELRPVNGVVHSIIVATEILNLRQKHEYKKHELKLHGSSSDLFMKTKNALDAILQQPTSWDLLSPRMQFLLKTTDNLLNLLYQKIVGDKENVTRT